MKSLITGIAGQDGSYLAEHLLELGHDVYGIVRRNSTPEHQESRIAHLGTRVTSLYGDVTDLSSLIEILGKVRPDYIFNLAAQSHVRISFDIPSFTFDVNARGAYNVFEAARQQVPNSRIYQASSSEMFGSSVDEDGFQRESTPMHPSSPYGTAKLFAYHTARVMRDSYSLHISNGILFNHESPRRGSNFVTTKIIRGALSVARGESNFLTLGNLDAFRDWGHSRDYVRAMVKILLYPSPEDFVISTGSTHSIRELCAYVFSKLGLNWEEHVRFDKRYLRPNEVSFLRGDSSKANDLLGWFPSISFHGLIDEMVEFWEKN